ncbi:MAG: D-glycero-D-manno-heptose 1-phosphate guanosyltransferase [Spirochaetes bacterium]|nr:MAG: D-glycero-D-manno-heptose 1-phosphate guanosyltransferase [Spirochaetota bacterium]
MQVVILCGGLGTRLKPITNKIPKVMIRFWGKPFLEYVRRIFSAQGFHNFVLCVGYKGEEIEKYYGDNMVYSYDGEKLLGTGGALKKAEPLLEDEFILVNGDTYLNMDYHDLISKFRESGKLAMMVVYPKRKKRNDVLVKDGLVLRYDKIIRKNVNAVWVGVMMMKKAVLKLAPKKKAFSLEFEIFPKLIKKKELAAYIVKNKFYPIGRKEQIREFIKAFQ